MTVEVLVEAELAAGTPDALLETGVTSAFFPHGLGHLLGIEKVGFFPWMHHFQPTYRVIIDVVRFDGSLDGEVVLSARWAIADADGKDYLVGGNEVYRCVSLNFSVNFARSLPWQFAP